MEHNCSQEANIQNHSHDIEQVDGQQPSRPHGLQTSVNVLVSDDLPGTPDNLVECLPMPDGVPTRMRPTKAALLLGRLLQDTKSKANVLELAAGSGVACLLAAAEGWNTWAAEDKSNLELLKKNLKANRLLIEEAGGSTTPIELDMTKADPQVNFQDSFKDIDISVVVASDLIANSNSLMSIPKVCIVNLVSN